MAIFGSRKSPAGPWGPREHHEFDLSGTKVSVDTPPQYHDLIEGTPPGKRTLNIYDTKKFGRYNKSDKDEAKSYGLMRKDWEFRGFPIIDGVIGSLKCNLSVYYLEGFKCLFRPRRMEAAVDRYIYNGGAQSTRHSGETRLKWRVVRLRGQEWINYEVNAPTALNNAEEVRLSIWHLAIAEEHMLTFYFRQIFRKNVPALRGVFTETINDVMGSIALELSDTSTSLKASAEAQFPWESVSESRPPYVFDQYESLDDYHMFCAVNEEFGETMTYEEKDKETKKRLREQKKLIKDTRKNILSSHLQFEALELQDRERYELSLAKKKVS